MVFQPTGATVPIYRHPDPISERTYRAKQIAVEENGRLKTRLQRDEVNLSELNELRKLYRLQQAGINDVTGAEVISSGKDPLSDKLIINKGSLDGLKAGDAVIDQNGLVGQLPKHCRTVPK